MSDGRINERILNGLQQRTRADSAIHQFLLDLVYEEAEHPGQWRWKGAYRTRVREYSEQWSRPDED